MTDRDKLVELVARAICRANNIDPDSDWRVSGEVMLTVKVDHPEQWRRHVDQARAALTAIEEAGWAVVPRELADDDVYAAADRASTVDLPVCSQAVREAWDCLVNKTTGISDLMRGSSGGKN